MDSKLLVLVMIVHLICMVTAQDSSCVRCCDYEPSNTPEQFSILRGEKGDTGERGLPGQIGKAGPIGEKGTTGEKGSNGFPGYRGPKGIEGDQGEPGASGPKGSIGPSGLQGPRGPKGLRGTKGDMGRNGQKGELYDFENWPVFSVARSSVQEGQSSHTTVTYDFTFVNIGNDMNLETGIFTCHIPGVYFFTFATLKYNNRHAAAFIMVNGTPKARIFGDNKDWQGMISQSLTITLTAGNTVWVRIDKHSEYRDVQLHSNNKHHTTFNGQLIRPAV